MGVFKCAKFKYDCSARNQTVKADPDIAGVGVIVGFLATTCLAFLVTLSVLFLDRCEKIITILRRIFTSNTEPYQHDESLPYWRSPDFWSRVLSKNLLALADTQIMTGLAVQFTAILKHCDLSIYHFQIVTELAFLTTVTHLLTVVALRNYFVKNRWVNLPRIFFMVGNLGLLGYTSFVSYTYDLAGLDLSSHLACFYQGSRPEFKAAFQTKWALLLVGAIGGHAAVILAMYVLPETPSGPPTTTFAWIKKIGATIRTWIIAPVYAIYGVYMVGTMLTNTQALGTPNVKMDGSENEWGFGQFLPVLLLALPVFAGWESFWEEKYDKNRDVDRFGRKYRISRSNTGLLDMEKGSGQNTHEAFGSGGQRDLIVGVSPVETAKLAQNSMTSINSFPTPDRLGVPHHGPNTALGGDQRPRTPSRFEEHLD